MAHYLIIGATSGIGGAVVQQLLDAGHTAYVTGRSAAAIEPLARAWGAPWQELDATDFDAVDAAMSAASTTVGVPVDGVVNCAGSLLLKPAHLTSREQYDAVIAASLTTGFATVRAAGKHLKGGGSVVLVSSAAALEGLPNHEAIAAAKAGLLGLMLSAAATYAGNNLRFNAVAPGLTATPLTQAMVANPLSLKVSESMHALGRIGQPEEVARAIVFLLDPNNSWITGQVLAVDGGLSRVRPRTKV